MSDTPEIRLVPFNDGREEECQCARCGGGAEFFDCDRCGGEGWYEGDRFGWDEGETVRCGECRGKGGFWSCGEKYDWCVAHPMPGRESISPISKVEWFEINHAPSLPEKASVENPVSGDRP